MFKKVVKTLLISLVGFSLLVPFAFAQESSPPTVDELASQLQKLRAEISQIKKTTNEARDIAVDSRLESAKFQEETLYRLGLWRERLGRGMMMSISAQDAAKRAEEIAGKAQDEALEAKELARTANEGAKLALSRVDGLSQNVDTLSQDMDSLKTDVSLAKQMAATAKSQAETMIKKLESRVDTLSQDVGSLKTDVSLAKQMAATAKAQADQARKEVRELRGEVQKNRELFLGKVEKAISEVKEKEEKFKAEKVELKAPAGKIYQVKKGDSLWSIAAEVYNNPTKWRKIFEANKDRMASPNSVYPGQKLVIPQE